MVWRTPKEKYDKKCLVSRVKHGGGGNAKVWGCFAWNGLGNLVFSNGNMTIIQNILHIL